MTFIARVIREEVAGELATIMLQLIRDPDVVEIAEGDEFVTVELQVDPFER